MIYLEIPNYSDPQAPGQTFTAYGIIASLNADFVSNRGTIVLRLYRTLQAMQANADYVTDLIIRDGGRIIRSGPQVGPTYPDMAHIESDNAQAWGLLWQYFLTHATALNGLTGATIRQTP